MALQTRCLFLKLSACSGGTARKSKKGSRPAIRVLGDELGGIQLRARCGVTGIEGGTSPLQYQKQLRLQVARQRMLMDGRARITRIGVLN